MQSSGCDVRRAHIDMKSEAATCLILEGVVEMMPQKYFLARTCFVIFRVSGKALANSRPPLSRCLSLSLPHEAG
jgi:hypothetical protein